MKKVLLVLVDGMRPDALAQVAHPEAEKYLSEGACTMQGSTVMPSVTLPCHMSLIHSVDPERHGVLTNTYVPQVRPITGLFDLLSAHGKKTAFFYNWGELRDLHRPGATSLEFFVSAYQNGDEESNVRIAEMAAEYLKTDDPDFTFLYLGEVDEVGHRDGWMSNNYLNAVSRSLDLIRKVRQAASPETVIMVTADHGGKDRSHGTDIPECMTIPFLTWNGPWEKGFTFPGMNIKDIAPTVTALFGLDPDRDWEGTSLWSGDGKTL